MTLNPELIDYLRRWMPATRARQKTRGPFGPEGFNETWARGGEAMCAKFRLTSNEWLAHVRHVDGVSASDGPTVRGGGQA